MAKSSKLQKLYQIMRNSEELGLPLNEETVAQINEMEEKLIKDEVLPLIHDNIEPTLREVERPLVLVVEYDPNGSLRVNLSRKVNITASISDAKEITPDPQVSHRTLGPQKTKKEEIAPKTLLRVTMPDGSVIERKKAKDTFIDVIRRIGIDKVRPLGLKFCKIPIISNTKDDKYGKAQHLIEGGWYILTHSSTADKKKQLEKIAKSLHLPMVIEIV